MHDSAVHHRPTGNYGYHIVQAAQAKVLLDWNRVLSHHLLFISPDEVSVLTGAYHLNTRAFHPPVDFAGLSSVREFAPIYEFAPCFDEGANTERPAWLRDYSSADGFFG